MSSTYHINRKTLFGFFLLYDTYSTSLFSVILFLIKNKEESEEILRNSFLEIWNNFDSYDADKGRLFTWMINIARNLSINSLRSKDYEIKIQKLKENVYTEEYIFTEEKMNSGTGLKKAINGLSSIEKELIELVYRYI